MSVGPTIKVFVDRQFENIINPLRRQAGEGYLFELVGK